APAAARTGAAHRAPLGRHERRRPPPPAAGMAVLLAIYLAVSSSRGAGRRAVPLELPSAALAAAARRPRLRATGPVGCRTVLSCLTQAAVLAPPSPGRVPRPRGGPRHRPESRPECTRADGRARQTGAAAPTSPPEYGLPR